MSDPSEYTTGKSGSLIQINDIVGLGVLGRELIRAVERGVGNWLEPWQRKRLAKADVEIFERWKAALKQVESLPSSVDLSLEGRTAIRLKSEQVRQQANRERVALAAFEEARLRADEHEFRGPSGIRIEDEWLDRFWRLAQDVTNEDLSALWGRILYREVRRPGTISPHTLEVISLLTRNDAEEIKRMASWTCVVQLENGAEAAILLLVPGANCRSFDRNAMKKLLTILNGNQIFRLDYFAALGVLQDPFGWSRGVAPICRPDGIGLPVANKSFVLRGFTADEIRASRDGEKPITLGGGLAWTSVGREILRLISTEPDPLYVDLLKKGWQLCGIELSPAGENT